MTSIADEYTHNGVNVRIYYDDEDRISPRVDDTPGCSILAWHRRADLGDEGLNYRDLPDFESKEELEAWLRDEHGAIAIRPLYAYEHGGITISLGAFSDPWDSGQVGYVFVTQQHVEDTGGEPDALMESDVKTYDAYLRGEVYGIVVDEDGDHQDSCWGYIGDIDYCKEYANLAADYVVEERAKEASERSYWAARDVMTVS